MPECQRVACSPLPPVFLKKAIRGLGQPGNRFPKLMMCLSLPPLMHLQQGSDFFLSNTDLYPATVQGVPSLRAALKNSGTVVTGRHHDAKLEAWGRMPIELADKIKHPADAARKLNVPNWHRQGIFWLSKACSACSTSLSLQQLCTPKDSILVCQGLLNHTCLACHQSSVAALSQSGSFAAISVDLTRRSVFRRSAEKSVFLWDGNVNNQIFRPRSEPSYRWQPCWTAGRCSPKHARAPEHLLAHVPAPFQGRATWKDTLKRHQSTVHVTACHSYLAKKPLLKFMTFLSKNRQSRNKSNGSWFSSRCVKLGRAAPLSILQVSGQLHLQMLRKSLLTPPGNSK